MQYRIVLISALGLALSACGGNAADPVAPAGDVTAPGGAAADPVVLTIDTETMADSDCHVMGEAVMGKCDDASIAKAVGAAELITVDTVTMADQACHYMGGKIMGTCTPEEIASHRVEHTILVDKVNMADQACHTMGNKIMGTCTAEEIKAQAATLAATW